VAIGRPRTFDREQALQRAIDVFWKHGYDATSVALLSQAMGITAPSLYSAFGDKRTLFLEALDRYLTTFGAFTVRALTEEPTAHRAIRRLLHDAADAYTRPDHPQGCLLITAATNCTPQSDDIKGQLRDIRAAGANAVEEKITAAIGAGELPADTDARALAAYYSAVIQGMSAKARDGATRDDLHAIAATAMRAWPQTAAPIQD
jgi:TetR/AcrR family transcriptional regulator, copper-responsive repressor